MRRVKYFVAASLNAYIAGPQGEVDWLFTDQDYGMKSFFAGIDTVLIGRKTYEFMLSHGLQSYPGFTNIVFSRTLAQGDHPEVTVHADDPGQLVAALKAQEGKDIWLVGGGALFVPPTPTSARLVLKHVTPYDTGLVTLHYRVDLSEADAV